MLKEHEEVIRFVINSYQEFQVEQEKFYDLFGLDGSYTNALHEFITHMLVSVQKLVGDSHSDWIGYYIYETDCGANPGLVKIEDKEIVIDSVDKIIGVMKL